MIEKYNDFINENIIESNETVELYDKEKYKTNKKLKIENKVKDFIGSNNSPENEKELEDFLLKYSNELLEDFPIDNMIDLIYIMNESRILISKLLKSMIIEYNKENIHRSQMSPSYRTTKTKINELQKIYNLLKNKNSK